MQRQEEEREEEEEEEEEENDQDQIEIIQLHNGEMYQAPQGYHLELSYGGNWVLLVNKEDEEVQRFNTNYLREIIWKSPLSLDRELPPLESRR